MSYRRSGGTKTSPLPDFFIGAHAAVAGLPLITRDVTRYQTYFPGLGLISPGSSCAGRSAAAIELYDDQGKPLPAALRQDPEVCTESRESVSR